MTHPTMYGTTNQLTQTLSPFRLRDLSYLLEERMLLKIFSALMVVLVALVGVLILAQQAGYGPTVNLSIFRDFFDVSLPVLAFGALIKYLCSFSRCQCQCGRKE